MSTMILAFVFMLVVISAMAIGVLFGRQPISGSCGGMKALGMDVECEICGGNPSLCESTTNPGETAQADETAAKFDPDLTKKVGD